MRKATTIGNRRPSRRKGPAAKRRPKLHGLLPVPPQVAEIVARETARLPMTKEARQRLENDLALQYHCGGDWVACRMTEKGVEVLAAGWEQVGKLMRTMPIHEQMDVRFDLLDSWE